METDEVIEIEEIEAAKIIREFVNKNYDDFGQWVDK